MREPDSDFPQGETYLSNAASYLLEGGVAEAASLLALCTLEFVHLGNWDGMELEAVLRGPRVVRSRLQARIVDGEHLPSQEHEIIKDALNALLSVPYYVSEVVAKGSLVTTRQDWRERLETQLRHPDAVNQAGYGDTLQWERLRFRSKTELRIAKAFEKREVLFFPNCRCRAGEPGDRASPEVDFLVCLGGRWGALEVDGDAYHPAKNRAREQAADRRLNAHGLTVVHHFPGLECYEDPEGVVDQFIKLLELQPR